jgi:hypothetical protein
MSNPCSTEAGRIAFNRYCRDYYHQHQALIRKRRKLRYESRTPAERKRDRERYNRNYAKMPQAKRERMQVRQNQRQSAQHKRDSNPQAFKPFFLEAAATVYGTDYLYPDLTRKFYFQEYRRRHWAQVHESTHKQRAKRLGLTEHFTAEQLLHKSNGCCMKCGATRNLKIVHLKLFRYGGDNTISNVCVLCKHCKSERNQ